MLKPLRIFPILVLCASLVFMTFYNVSAEEPVSHSTQLILLKAEKELNSKKYAEARNILSDYLKRTRERPCSLVYYLLGNAWYLGENRDKALEAYSEAYRLNSKSFPISVNLAKVCYELKKYRKSANLFLHAYKIEKEPENELLYHAAAGYFQAKQYTRAKTVLKQLLGIKGNIKKPWLKLFVYTCLELKNWDEAERSLMVFLERVKTDATLWKLLAQVRSQKGDYRGAAGSFEIAYRLKPPKKEKWKELANIYFYLGIPLNAVRCLQKAFGENPSPGECDQLSKGYAQAHRLEKAIFYLNRAIEKNPSASRYLEIGKIYYQNGIWKKALKPLQECLNINPHLSLANLLLGICAWETGNVSLARKAFAEAKKDKKYRTQASAALSIMEEDS